MAFSHLYSIHLYHFHPNPLCPLWFSSSSHQSPSSFCPGPLLLSYFNMRGTMCAMPWLWRSEDDHKSVLTLHLVSKESLSLTPCFGDILPSAPPIFHMCAMVSSFFPLSLGWYSKHWPISHTLSLLFLCLCVLRGGRETPEFPWLFAGARVNYLMRKTVNLAR